MTTPADLQKAFADKNAQEHMSLTTLQRIDPSIDRILSAGGHVALYGLDDQTNTWARKDVEGSLFLLSRRVEPHYQIFVLNKKSQDNYVESLSKGFRTELTPPYLYFTNESEQVVGIWFYEPTQCAKLDEKIEQLQAVNFSGREMSLGPNGAASSVSVAPRPQEDAFWDKAVSHSVHESELLKPQEFTLEQLRVQQVPPHQAVQPGTITAVQGGGNDLTRLFAKANMRVNVPNNAKADPPKPKREPPAPTPFPGFPPVPYTSVPPISSPSVTPSLHGKVDASPTVATHGQPVQPPAISPPQLLTPSFFQTRPQVAHAVKPQEKAAGQEQHVPEPTQAQHTPTNVKGGENANTLNDLFARAVKPPAARLGGSDVPQALQGGQQARGNGELPRPATVKANSAQTERVRQAIIALANSDDFLDLIVGQLTKSGVLQG